ncbi:MAG: hypothetical protein P4L84_01815 [Isosphaeraceae bacterium]|nr:hypothetical protein [Isosphaeraceae bacterium]
MEPIDATIHLAFAFDIGYEIDLERARTLLSAESANLVRRRRTPESIRYRPAPVRTVIDGSGIFLPNGASTITPSRAELSIFDFAALSLAIQYPVRMTPAELLKLAGALAEPAPLTAAARRVLEPWIVRIRPAVVGFEFSEISEEYVVFQVGEANADWLEAHRDWIAGLVRLESSPLSKAEVMEATRLSLSYTPNDLVALDWAAGVVADPDCADTLQVIEFANVQLLEFRHIDDRLDDRLEAAYRLIRPETRGHGPRVAWHSHRDAVHNVRELEIEATSLFERADNALKLIGDQYLSRVFDLASTRFHLRDWQHSIRRKLDTVGDVYDLLIQQAGGSRMETLEFIVIVLIALEIVLALLRR